MRGDGRAARALLCAHAPCFEQDCAGARRRAWLGYSDTHCARASLGHAYAAQVLSSVRTNVYEYTCTPCLVQDLYKLVRACTCTSLLVRTSLYKPCLYNELVRLYE